jgi:pimeloyl-ACP methyl ester carboxylesterase
VTETSTQGSGLVRRIAMIVAGILVVAVVGVFGVARATDPETLVIDQPTRDSVAKATGGAFNRGRDGVTYYELAGPDTAPLVVLAAGSSVPGYIWQPTYDTLKAAGYHVMRYDYFGRGWSDRPEIALTQDVYVRQLVDLLDSLHVTKPITLAGISYGGTVITSFAAAQPQRVGALVYMDPAVRTAAGSVPWFIKVAPIGDLMMQWQSRTWASGQLGDFLHPEKYPNWPDRYLVQMRYKGFRHGRLSANIANADVNHAPALAELAKNPRPVLVVWGKQDPTVPFARSKVLLAALPQAKFVPVDSAGHLPMWEQPAVTHAALFEFLRANALPTPVPANGVAKR